MTDLPYLTIIWPFKKEKKYFWAQNSDEIWDLGRWRLIIVRFIKIFILWGIYMYMMKPSLSLAATLNIQLSSLSTLINM